VYVYVCVSVCGCVCLCVSVCLCTDVPDHKHQLYLVVLAFSWFTYSLYTHVLLAPFFLAERLTGIRFLTHSTKLDRLVLACLSWD